jgi:signal transduction histidine kinase/HAMP domain-containing protein
VTLKQKLLGVQGVLALALLVVGAVSIISLRNLGRGSSEILRDNYRSVLAAQRMTEIAERLDDDVLFRASGRPQASDPRAAERFERELDAQEANITERGEREGTAALRAAWTAYREVFRRLEAETRPEALVAGYFDELEPRFRQVRAAAQHVLDLNQDAIVRKSERASHLAGTLVVLVLVATVAGLLAGTLLATWLTSRIVRPVSVLAQAAQRIASGDLTARARVRGQDEIARLGAEFNAMADSLAEYRQSSLGELLQAQQASQAAIDGLPDPVLVMDVAGRLQNVNAAAEAMLRLGPAGQALEPLAALDPALRAAVEQVRDHVVSGRGPWQPRGYEEAVRIDGPEGSRWLLPRASALHAGGGAVTGVAVVLQEVTRLMRIDELKNDLVATVAHELRTPLTSLSMAIHLCVEEAAGPVTDKQAELLLAAREDCQRLQDIVTDLLDLSRIQGGRVELLRRPVQARSLLEGAAAAARDSAAGAGVTVAVHPGQADEEEVAADPERVALVLSNLVSNAVRHSPAGATVTLSTAPAAGAVRFDVADRGEGVPREYQERIFERFFRAPGRASGGVGLGLYLVRELVQAHGGQVGVESAPGQGSRFWFTLPLADHEGEDGG